MKKCLDLFAGLGGFSAAFEDSDGWSVTTVDVESDFEPDITANILNLTTDDLGNDYDVILASPPCTHFSPAGNHDKWDMREGVPNNPETKENIAFVHHALSLIYSIAPEYWFLENPRGRMRWVIGDPEATVTYCQYGTSYQKPTDLWGRHPRSMEYRSCPRGGSCHTRSVADDGTEAVAEMPDDAAERALVPYELSEAILKSVENPEPNTKSILDC